MSDYIQSVLEVAKAYDREIMSVETKKLEEIQDELTILTEGAHALNAKYNEMQERAESLGTEVLRLREEAKFLGEENARILEDWDRLREAHRHCWHDNAPYLCEGETCGDSKREETT